MRILVVGGSGMLGHKLVQVWDRDFDVWTTLRHNIKDYQKFKIFNPQKTLENVDVENIASVEKAVEKLKPEVIVNAVGVIKQIPSANKVIKTLTINSIFPHQLAELARQTKSKLISISTDCVFSGIKGNYSESDIPDAYDLYGRSKQFGEVIDDNCLTIRTSIIGRELKTSHSLVEWFLNNREKSVKGFKNAIFSGFPTIILADIISNLIKNHSGLSGLYHVSSEPINKFDLLHLIKEAYQSETDIVEFDDFVIDRSLDSAKFREATGFQPLPWREMIRKMADDKVLYKY